MIFLATYGNVQVPTVYSNEGKTREPVHVHVMKDGGEAKFWLHPVSFARNTGFDTRT